MKKLLKITLISLAVVFAGMQFYRIDQTAPPVVAAEAIEAAVYVPEDVALVLARSCNDCHSYTTVYPWYAQVMPFSAFLDDHIMEGRKELNFSSFATYSPARQAKKLEEICEEVKGGHMPLPSYLWIHRDAVLSENEKALLCDWTEAARAAVEARR